MDKKPPTFAEQFYLTDATRWQRFKRDCRLLMWIASNFYMWFKTIKVRKAYAESQKNGEPFYVDRFTPPWAKK